MSFTASTYQNLIAQQSPQQERLFPQYKGWRTDFDIIIIGSGIGGGLLADDLANRLGKNKRILVLEAGGYVFPTHVYNVCRFPNYKVAANFACKTFWQDGNMGSEYYIHEQPQLNFGGRSVFWSGLIPSIQNWELDFFPKHVKHALLGGYLKEAGKRMNESVTMGRTAQEVVKRLSESPLGLDFDIRETPRALHQPYLTADGELKENTFKEPTGVFNTAELLINQVGLVPGVNHGDHKGLFMLLNHYVEDIKNLPWDRYEIIARDTLSGGIRAFQAGTVVMAGGSIESPKLLRRSSLFNALPDEVKPLIGKGLTDHPTTHWIDTYATHMGSLSIPKDSHAKIIFYSRGRRDTQNRIMYPFNIEMNINHEYFHLRENDPAVRDTPVLTEGDSWIQIKFSFGNCLDEGNEVRPAPPFEYVPEVKFRNLSWMDQLAQSRFPALAGWEKNYDEIFAVLNEMTYRVFSQFQNNGSPCRPVDDHNQEVWYGQNGKGFGLGTVHHAIGTLRMPYRLRYDGIFQHQSVVDEDLRVRGTKHLYVCDMSVMPFSAAANPVRTLVALALRMSNHFG
jgi:hypothetical protein